MQVTLEIPEAVAASWCSNPAALATKVLEDAAAAAYGRGELNARQVRELLGHGSRHETQEFLASRGVLRDLSADDIIRDAEVAWAARKVT